MVKQKVNTKLAVILTLLVALCLTGCGQISEVAVSQPPEISAPVKTEYVPRSTAAEDLNSSPWKDVPVMRLDFDKKLPLALSDDGDLVYFESSGENDECETLYICNLDNGVPEQIASIEQPEQIIGAYINDRWIVWQEYLYGDGFGDGSCAVWAYERSSKTTMPVYISDSTKSTDNVSWKKAPRPCLRGDKVLLDTLMAVDEDTELSINSYEYDLITGKKTLVAEQMLCPEYQEDCIIGVGQDANYSENGCSVICKAVDGEVTPLMNTGMFIYEYTTDGYGDTLYTGQSFRPRAGITEDQSRDLYLIEDGKTTLLREQTSVITNDGCAWPSLSKRVAMWNQNLQLFVYDRALDTTIALTTGDEFTVGFFATEKYIVWTYNSDENIAAGIREVDMVGIIAVSDLPKSLQ
jgi:hypothetical protein